MRLSRSEWSRLLTEYDRFMSSKSERIRMCRHIAMLRRLRGIPST